MQDNGNASFTGKIFVLYFGIILAIVIPPLWPVLFAWGVWMHLRAQKRREARVLLPDGQPVRLPGQQGAL